MHPPDDGEAVVVKLHHDHSDREWYVTIPANEPYKVPDNWYFESMIIPGTYSGTIIHAVEIRMTGSSGYSDHQGTYSIDQGNDDIEFTAPAGYTVSKIIVRSDVEQNDAV